MLDGQVVRAAVKAYKNHLSTTTTTTPEPTVSPFTRFLRRASEDRGAASSPSPVWHDPHAIVALLERRALCVVRSYVAHESDPDASAANRVARAVTEAFVAAQVEGFVRSLPSQLPGQEAHVVCDLLLLVR